MNGFIRKSLLACTTALVSTGTAFADGADLTIFDWSGYEDEGFFAGYMATHTTAPSYTYFGSVEEAFTKLQSGFTADLAHPCSDAVRKWVAADLLEPLDTSRLTNWDNLLPEIKEVDGIEIDGNVYMMPFEWGNTGLIYRTDLISGDDISLQLMADPAYQGKIAVPDAASSAYALAALATGVENYTNMTDEEFERASDYLRAIHPNVRFYWTDGGQFDQAMASGEIEMGWAWNQSELNLIWNETPAVMVKDTDIGIATWVCGYVHLKSSTTPDDQIYDMLNALSDVGSGQYIIENWGYAHANAQAYDVVDGETLAAYGFDDVQKFFDNSLFFDAVEPSLESRMLREFERIKSGF